MGHALASSVLGFAVGALRAGHGRGHELSGLHQGGRGVVPEARARRSPPASSTPARTSRAMLQGAMMALARRGQLARRFRRHRPVRLGLARALAADFIARPRSTRSLGAEESSADPRRPRSRRRSRPRSPGPCLLRYREAWAFLLGKMLTDPVWWFYLTWLPTYLKRERDVSLDVGGGGAGRDLPRGGRRQHLGRLAAGLLMRAAGSPAAHASPRC